jgi:hypothetical protein
MDTVKLTVKELVELIGLKKAQKAYPDMFKDEEKMHIIEEGQISDLLTVASGDASPAAKYDGKCLKLSNDYHWSIIRRTINGSFNSFLIPIKKEYSRRNPLNKLRSAANFGKMKKVAARRKKRTRKTEE